MGGSGGAGGGAALTDGTEAWPQALGRSTRALGFTMYRTLRVLARSGCPGRAPTCASAPGVSGSAVLPTRLPHAARMVSAGRVFPRLPAVTFSPARCGQREAPGVLGQAGPRAGVAGREAPPGSSGVGLGRRARGFAVGLAGPASPPARPSPGAAGPGRGQGAWRASRLHRAPCRNPECCGRDEGSGRLCVCPLTGPGCVHLLPRCRLLSDPPPDPVKLLGS